MKRLAAEAEIARVDDRVVTKAIRNVTLSATRNKALVVIEAEKIHAVIGTAMNETIAMNVVIEAVVVVAEDARKSNRATLIQERWIL